MIHEPRRGDPVAYRVWRFDSAHEEWGQVDREANVTAVAGEEYGTRRRKSGAQDVVTVPDGHVRILTPHDGGKHMTLPLREVWPR